MAGSCLNHRGTEGTWFHRKNKEQKKKEMNLQLGAAEKLPSMHASNPISICYFVKAEHAA